MKLYYHPVSVTSRALWLFIEDNRLDVELEVVDLLKGEHHQEPFSKLNPNRLVPVLDDDGFVLSECSAIFKYLAEKFDLTSYPKDLQARARVNERMDWFNTQFFREYGYNLLYPQLFPQHKRASEAAQQETLRWGKERAAQAMQVLNEHILGGADHVCGRDITIADYHGVGLVTGGELIRIDFSNYPHVENWLSRMKSRSAWSKVNQVHEGFKASLAEQQFVNF